MKTLVVWFIGSNATGKTTQAAMLHNWMRRGEMHELVITRFGDNNKNCFTTLSEFTVNLGKFVHPLILPKDSGHKPLECCGTDTLSTKKQIMESFHEACNHSPIVVVEGVMATGQWIKFLKNDETEVALIHIDLDLQTNLERLIERRRKKQDLPVDYQLKEKTIKNIGGKVRGFTSMFDKLAPQVDYSLRIDGTNTIVNIHDSITDFIMNIIL